MAVVGIVARTRGRHGEVVVAPRTDFPEERFRAGGTLYLERAGEPTAVTIRSAWFHGGRPVVAFDRIGTIGEAEGLRGAELRVPESALLPLPADTWYEHDLIGCTVRTADGAEVGTVGGVEGPAGAQRLLVRQADGEIDVPLVAAICIAVDTAAGAIVIDPPDGLLEVNREGRPKVRRSRRRRSGHAPVPAGEPARAVGKPAGAAGEPAGAVGSAAAGTPA